MLNASVLDHPGDTDAVQVLLEEKCWQDSHKISSPDDDPPACRRSTFLCIRIRSHDALRKA